MKAMMDGVWYEMEEHTEGLLWPPETYYTVKDDPERGSFTAADFEAVS